MERSWTDERGRPYATEAVRQIGELCVEGDRACARGDLRALQDIARQLGAYVPEPVHCELDAIATACATDPAGAVTLWERLKTSLYRDA